MKKKLIIFTILFIILLFGINLYKKKTETIECWWGVMYPTLSYVGFEDTDETKISSVDTNYVYVGDNKVKYKFAIVEWFNNLFSF